MRRDEETVELVELSQDLVEPPPKPVAMVEPVSDPLPSESRPTSGRGRKKNSRPSSGKDKKSSRPSSSKEKKDSRPTSKGKKGSRESSARSKSSKSSKKGKKAPEPEIPDPITTPQPGDAQYEWLPYLEQNDAKSNDREYYLRLHQSHLDSTNICRRRSLICLDNIRRERGALLSYLGNVITDFPIFLARPDPKQEYVEQWQLEYNRIPDDMRHNDEVKNELHQRLVDLQEQLYDCSDSRKAEAEEHRAKIMTNSWLKDRLKLLITHYVNLSKQELFKTSIETALMRKHYAFQAQLPLTSNPHIKDVIQQKATTEIDFNIMIETNELAEDEKIVDLAEVDEAINATFEKILNDLNEICNYESKLLDEIKFSPNADVTKELKPKSPKGGKDKKKPKSPKGGKGKIND